MSRDQIDTSLRSLFTLAGTRGKELGPPLVLAALNLSESVSWLMREEVMKLAEELDDSRIRAVTCTWRVERLSRQLHRAAELASNHLEFVS